MESTKVNVSTDLYDHFGDDCAVFNSYNCSIESDCIYSGHMYITIKNVYFYSKLYNIVKKIRISLRNVRQIKREGATMGYLTDAIYITTGIKLFFENLKLI